MSKYLESIPPGFKLRHMIRGHRQNINRIAWDPNGRLLASPSEDRTIRLWDSWTGQHFQSLIGHSTCVLSVVWSPGGQVIASGSKENTVRLWEVKTGDPICTFEGHTHWVIDIAWSPDGKILASGSFDKTIRLWDWYKKRHLFTFEGHTGTVNSIAWSLNGYMLASASHDMTIRLWNTRNQQLICILRGHSGPVVCLEWSHDGQVLASSSLDGTIRLWDTQVMRPISILEGHQEGVSCVSFSSDDRLLASKSVDGTVRIWRTSSGDVSAVLQESNSPYWPPSLAFHPYAPILATLDEEDTAIRIWDLDFAMLLRSASPVPPIHYVNAKVVLVGDSGVGKTGLSLVLAGHPFAATESTHGRHVWTFESKEVNIGSEYREIRETLLWDLAGQPSSRLIHQLHLNEVVVALVIFDARSDIDPLAGVYYWDRALRQIQHVRGSQVVLKKFLIAARIDCEGKSISPERIQFLTKQLGFAGYFETSAKEGLNIIELTEAIKQVIDWSSLPKVSSTSLFQRIKTFLLTEKEARRQLSTVDDLYLRFLQSMVFLKEDNDLRAQFEICIKLVESRDLIRQLNFGNLVLLQPELLDIYASALINAAKNEPDGLGCISEAKVRSGQFLVPADQRLTDKGQEKLLLIALIEYLLQHEIMLREDTGDEAFLVFPSQSTREKSDLSGPEGKAATFTFEGPVLNIYATLAVRLSHSGIFKRKEIWKNGMTYTTLNGGMCGIYLYNSGEGRGELTLFFDQMTSEDTCFYFEKYVEMHLKRRALPESIQRRHVFACPACSAPFTDVQIEGRRKRGFNWIKCSVCDTQLSILDREEQLTTKSNMTLVSQMESNANNQREHSVIKAILQGKIETDDFDVFLCHNREDKPQVKSLGAMLKEYGLLPWLDEWNLRPGLPRQRLLEQQIKKIKSVAVFVGSDGIGPWQQVEVETFLREFVNRGCPVIPVLLPNAPTAPQLPPFLKIMTWVDFRVQDPDPVEQLIWGITGEKSYLRFSR